MTKLARHETQYPFPCQGVLRLSIEPNPLPQWGGDSLIATRCLACGRVTDVWRVMAEEPSLEEER